jgi:hypothetical protein
VKKQHPEMTRNQVMNIVAGMWKAVSVEERVCFADTFWMSEHCSTCIRICKLAAVASGDAKHP